MSPYKAGLAMIFLTGIIVYAGHARAEPPPVGMKVSFAHPMVVCNKAEDIQGLISAQRGGTFDEAVKPLMDKIECQIGKVASVVIIDSKDLGTIDWNPGVENVWMIHFNTTQGEKFSLYEELVAHKENTSI
jgi:hypothetical protein